MKRSLMCLIFVFIVATVFALGATFTYYTCPDRYKIVFGSAATNSRPCFKIDTFTGRVWIYSFDGTNTFTETSQKDLSEF